MDKQAYFNTKYLKLCQELGDCEVKREQLESHIKNIKQKIETLNECFPLLSEYEKLAQQQKAQELAESQKKAKELFDKKVEENKHE